MISLLSNLFFAGVLISALKMRPMRALIFAFFSGLILDISFAQTLGFTSILFLFASGITQALKQRFSFSNPLAPLILSFFLYFLFQLATGKNFGVLEAIFLSFLVAIFSLQKRKTLAI